MCSVLQGSERPFCVNSTQKREKKTFLQPLLSPFLLTFILIYCLDFAVFNWKWFVKLSYVMLQLEKNLIAVKVIAEKTQNRMTFFWNSLYSSLGFGVRNSVRLQFPSFTKTSVELHLQLQI